MKKHPNKQDAEIALSKLVEQLKLNEKPQWLKNVEIRQDDHEFHIELKLTQRQKDIPVKIPGVVDGNVKVCTLYVGG